MPPGSMTTFQFSVARQLIRHKRFYDDQLRGVLGSLPPKDTMVSSAILSREVAAVARVNGNKYRSMRQMLEMPLVDVQKLLGTTTPNAVAMQALRQLNFLRKQSKCGDAEDFGVNYSFKVGEIVQDPTGTVGVIAARLPFSLVGPGSHSHVESVAIQQGEIIAADQQASDEHTAPVYVVLASRQGVMRMPLVEHINESKLTTAAPQSIGFHSYLPVFFSGFSSQEGRYVAVGECPSETTSVLMAATPVTETQPVTVDVAEPKRKRATLKRRPRKQQTTTVK